MTTSRAVVGRFGRRRTDDDTDDRRGAGADDDLEDALAKSRRGTIDLGLLLLRVALGGLVGAHGLQKLFGLWNGPRLSGFESMLVDAGFTADYAQILRDLDPARYANLNRLYAPKK